MDDLCGIFERTERFAQGILTGSIRGGYGGNGFRGNWYRGNGDLRVTFELIPALILRLFLPLALEPVFGSTGLRFSELREW